MSSKHKLNSAHLLGALALASLFGSFTGSVAVFVIVLLVLLLAAHHAGNIRA